MLCNRSESKYENATKSLKSDLKLDDLYMSTVKSSERRMEAGTGVMDMYSDDLCIGVKSLSNLAMAGSY
jgi:hypothetical protein